MSSKQMPGPGLSKCFSCGAWVEDVDGPVHRYMASAPGCWAAYGAVLAREYSDARFARNHRLTVDAYALQHPGDQSPQSIQSVAVHLVSLCAIFEHEMALPRATLLLKALSNHKSACFWLEPPRDFGRYTVRDVLRAVEAEDHVEAVGKWAESTWAAWKAHHGQAAEWLAIAAQDQQANGHRTR